MKINIYDGNPGRMNLYEINIGPEYESNPN